MPLSGIWIKYSVMFDVEKVRRDFPILGVRVYDKPLVYLAVSYTHLTLPTN